MSVSQCTPEINLPIIVIAINITDSAFTHLQRTFLSPHILFTAIAADHIMQITIIVWDEGYEASGDV